MRNAIQKNNKGYAKMHIKSEKQQLRIEIAFYLKHKDPAFQRQTVALAAVAPQIAAQQHLIEI